MTRVWFNKTFSSIGSAIRLIREADKGDFYEIVCSNTNAHAPAFRAANASHVEPTGLTSEQYLEWSLQFCKTTGIDIFIPGKETSLISAHRDLFESQGTRVLCAGSSETLDLMHNKARFYEDVKSSMVPAADFRIIENGAQFNDAYSDLKQLHERVCIKPSVSVYGLGFSVIDEVRSSAQLLLEGVQYHIGLNDLRNGLIELGTFRSMLVMEYLNRNEYSVDCVGDHGKLICAIPRKKSLTPGRGQTIEMNETILESTLELTKKYRLNGNFNAQFREGKNGIRLLEINPRMSGGIAMASLAGPNLPWLALTGFDHGFENISVPAIKNGLRVGEDTVAVELE